MNKEKLLEKIEMLQPGDIILQLGDNPIADKIQRYDRGNYSHTRLYCGKNENGEHETIEIGFRGVKKYEIFDGFKTFKSIQFRGFRHTFFNENKKQNTAKLIATANKYIGDAYYASRNQIDLLTKILSADYFIKNLPCPQLLRQVYEKAFHTLIRARRDGKPMFTCSGFIFQIFHEIGFKIKNNRFKFPATYKSISNENNFSGILKEIDHFNDDASFVSFLQEKGMIEDEITDAELETTLNSLDGFFLTHKEDKELNELIGSNTRSLGDINSKEKQAQIQKAILARDLFFILYDQLLNSEKFPVIFNNKRLVKQKSIKEILSEYKNKKLLDYSEHVFFTPSDLAISSSLEPVFGITKMNYNEL